MAGDLKVGRDSYVPLAIGQSDECSVLFCGRVPVERSDFFLHPVSAHIRLTIKGNLVIGR